MQQHVSSLSLGHERWSADRHVQRQPQEENLDSDGGEDDREISTASDGDPQIRPTRDEEGLSRLRSVLMRDLTGSP